MSTYAIGDIQGCYDDLQRLLEQLSFDPATDRLWFAGDLVNRGPKSLEVLRFVRGLGEGALSVLGNHDLHLLAVWQNKHRHFKSNDTLLPILRAADGEELIDWLRHLPLMHHDPELGFSILHAGLPPQWDLNEALARAAEVEEVLRGEAYTDFLDHMYGNQPDRWEPGLQGWDRLRFIVNCFSRLRYCKVDGTMEFKSKGQPGTQEAGYHPWFAVPGRRSHGARLVFGHWSTLGLHSADAVYCIDSGCLWGGRLSALRLDGENAGTVVSCPCPQGRRD